MSSKRPSTSASPGDNSFWGMAICRIRIVVFRPPVDDMLSIEGPSLATSPGSGQSAPKYSAKVPRSITTPAR